MEMSMTRPDDHPLSETDLDQVCGGADVRIEQMTTSVDTGGGGLSSGVLGKILGFVVDSLKNQGRPH
jgi:hypothetical protein